MFIGSAFLVFGIGALCVLVCRLAVDALPAFAGCTAGFWAYDTGAGPIGAIIVAFVAGATTLAAGRLVFDTTRNGGRVTAVRADVSKPAGVEGRYDRSSSAMVISTCCSSTGGGSILPAKRSRDIFGCNAKVISPCRSRYRCCGTAGSGGADRLAP